MSGIIRITLLKERETKNMQRYVAEGGEDAQHTATVPLVYIRKTHLATAFSKFPEKIEIIIEESGK